MPSPSSWGRPLTSLEVRRGLQPHQGRRSLCTVDEFVNRASFLLRGRARVKEQWLKVWSKCKRLHSASRTAHAPTERGQLVLDEVKCV
eukprot:6201417-Pleurochrysis_carterae.AAC.3